MVTQPRVMIFDSYRIHVIILIKKMHFAPAYYNVTEKIILSNAGNDESDPIELWISGHRS